MAVRRTNRGKGNSRQEGSSYETFLYEELQDIYDAEKQLTKAIPRMVKGASSDELREALEEHLEVTQEQVSRLEQVFELLGRPTKGRSCAGMKGLIEEGKEHLEKADEPFGDAAIISSAQKVEHYEIAAYGTARTVAEVLGRQEVADLLQETLDEEKEADEKLTEIARNIYEAHGLSVEGMEEEEWGAEGKPSFSQVPSGGAKRMERPRVDEAPAFGRGPTRAMGRPLAKAHQSRRKAS